MNDVLSTHRLFYEAFETGDADLIASLWMNDRRTSCVHPGGTPIYGTEAILRSWSVLMANAGYVQFFLTDVEVSRPPGAPDLAMVTCTENILAGVEMDSPQSFAGGSLVCSSVLVRTATGWKFWSRHASPVAIGVEEV